MTAVSLIEEEQDIESQVEKVIEDNFLNGFGVFALKSPTVQGTPTSSGVFCVLFYNKRGGVPMKLVVLLIGLFLLVSGCSQDSTIKPDDTAKQGQHPHITQDDHENTDNAFECFKINPAQKDAHTYTHQNDEPSKNDEGLNSNKPVDKDDESPQNNEGQNTKAVDKNKEKTSTKENKIDEWIERSRQIQLGQAREIDNKLYLLATYGKNNGGSVEITDITEDHDEFEEKLVVTVDIKENDSSSYDIQSTEPVDKPVIFVAKQDGKFFPNLRGTDYLKPIVAKDENIKLFSPEPQTLVEDQVKVTGIEQAFEGTVNSRLLDKDGSKLDDAIGSGYGFDWGYFEMKLDVPDDFDGDAMKVEVYSICPKHGEKDSLVKMDLKKKGGG